MIPYKGKVTIERTLKYIKETMGYNLNDYNFTDLRFRLSEEDLSYYIFKIIKQDQQFVMNEGAKVEECLDIYVEE